MQTYLSDPHLKEAFLAGNATAAADRAVAATWAAWAAWDAPKAAAFYPALADYALALLRALPASEAPA